MTSPDLGDVVRDRRRQRDFDGAARLLHERIGQSQDRRELAELYGMLGGTRREQGDLRAAAAAYDAGSRYESETESTYNELNRLVTRILLDPASLSNPEALASDAGLERLDVPRRLAELQAQMMRNRERVGDYWASGDLALTAALNGDADLELDALKEFGASSAPSSAYAKYRETFATLADLDTLRKGELTTALDWLDRNSGQAAG